jgi:hypothetical protein
MEATTSNTLVKMKQNNKLDVGYEGVNCIKLT